jgi:apolipoprotein N-acyltransferase
LSAIAIFDLLRAYFPFGGFPWGFPSTVLLTGPLDRPLFFEVPLYFKNFGPTGSSLLLQSLPLVIALGIFSKNKQKKYLKNYIIFLLIIFIILISNFLVSDYQDSQIETSELNITIVQGNSPCPGAKNRCNNERQKIYDSHLAQTQSLDGTFDLVVWPESSTGFNNDPGIHSRVQNEIAVEALRLDSYFLIGGDRPVQNQYFENYGIFINKDGEIVDQYLKQHPVPFGEYIPFRKYLDWIPPLALVPRDMIRGDGQKIFMVNDTKISTVISFEGSFQRYIRNSVQDGAELVVILTNQASYGESGMSDQFVLMSRANAISNSRPIVHAAITGKSAFIDHRGKVISKTELFETEVLTEKIEVKQTETPYSRYGNYLNYVFIVFGAISLLWSKNIFKKI